MKNQHRADLRCIEFFKLGVVLDLLGSRINVPNATRINLQQGHQLIRKTVNDLGCQLIHAKSVGTFRTVFVCLCIRFEPTVMAEQVTCTCMFCVCMCVCACVGFFLVCEDFGRMFNNSLPSCALSFFKSRE